MYDIYVERQSEKIREPECDFEPKREYLSNVAFRLLRLTQSSTSQHPELKSRGAKMGVN